MRPGRGMNAGERQMAVESEEGQDPTPALAQACPRWGAPFYPKGSPESFLSGVPPVSTRERWPAEGSLK